MGLDFQTRNIPNYEENYPNKENWVTWAIVHRMMFTGLGWELTEKNAAEFYARNKFLDAVQGTILRNGDGTERFISVEDVRNHIGLTVNIRPETRGKFIKRNLDISFEEWIKEYENDQG